jgi:hypothetical protein
MREETRWVTVELNKKSGHNMIEILTNSSKFLQYYTKLLKEYDDTKQSYTNDGYKIIQEEPDKFKFVAEKKFTYNDEE